MVGPQLTGAAAHSAFLSNPLIRGRWKDYSSGLWVQAASGGEAVREKKVFFLLASHAQLPPSPWKTRWNTCSLFQRRAVLLQTRFCSLVRCSSSKDDRPLTEDDNKYSALWPGTVHRTCIFWTELELKWAGASIWSWLRQEGVGHWGSGQP